MRGSMASKVLRLEFEEWWEFFGRIMSRNFNATEALAVKQICSYAFKAGVLQRKLEEIRVTVEDKK